MQYVPIAASAYTAGRAFYHWNKRRAGPKSRRGKRRKRCKTFRCQVKDIVNGMSEPKYINTPLAISTAVANTGSISLLSGIAEGTTELERVGQVVALKSIQIRGEMVSDPDATSDTHYKVDLVRANTNIEGVIPTLAEIFETVEIYGLPNIDTKGDYSIFPVAEGVLKAPDIASQVRVMPINYSKYFKTPRKMTYDGATAAIGDCEKGHWFLVIRVSQPSTFQPTFGCNIRFFLVDV